MSQKQVMSIFNSSIGPFVQAMKTWGFPGPLMSYRDSPGGTLITLPWSGPLEEYPEEVARQMGADLADLAANGDKDSPDALLRALDGAKKLSITNPHMVLHRIEHWDGLDLERDEIRMWVSLEREAVATGQHNQRGDNMRADIAFDEGELSERERILAIIDRWAEAFPEATLVLTGLAEAIRWGTAGESR